MKDIYEVLKNLNIKYEKINHPAVFTVEEADQYMDKVSAVHTKNLFLRDKKGRRHFLVVAKSTTVVDLKKLTETLCVDRLSFASPERLKEHLGVTPGSVSPFTLINDEKKSVEVIIDNGLLNNGMVGFHPNLNTATLIISPSDFQKFLSSTDHQITYLDF